MGVVAGLVFAGTSWAYGRLAPGSARPVTMQQVLISLMILLTLVSQFAISPRMAAVRAELGVIDEASPSGARRVEFDRLHQWSVRTEATVLVLGLALLYLTVRKTS